MAAPLRPMNLGEILDRTFEIYRKQLWVFVGIASLPALVMLALHSVDIAWVHTDRLIHAVDPGEVDEGEYVLWRWVVGYGYSHISSFLNPLLFPAFVWAASSEIFGESTTIVASLRFALARWRTYLWLAFLLLAATLILPEAIGFGVFFGTGTLEDKLGLMGDSPSIPAIVILLLMFPATAFFVLWAKASLALSVPAAALEQLTAIKALRRGWSLMKENRWRVILTWLAVAVCWWVLSGAAWYALRWVVYLLYNVWELHWINQHMTSQVAYVLYAAIAAFIGPIFPIALTLSYYDQRVRKEGYDLEKMMEAAGLAEANDEIGNALAQRQIGAP